MTARTHDELVELLGAYSLDAVDADERDEMVEHLESCPRCRAELAELREVAAALATSGGTAPAGVWDRIAAAIDEEPPPMRVAVLSSRRRNLRRGVVAVGAVAATAALLALGLQVRDLHHDNDRIRRALADTASTQHALNAANQALLASSSKVARLDGASGMHALVVLTDQSTGYLIAADVAPLPTGIYELWAADSAGTVVPVAAVASSEVSTFTVGPDVRTLMVTIEPSFTTRPSSAPVMQGDVF